MRKFLFVAAVAALVLAIAGTAFAAIQQTYKVKVSPSKAKKNSTVDLFLASKDTTKPGNLAPRATTVILIDPGTYIAKGAPQCNVSTAQLVKTQCANNTIVGSGEVKAAITTAVISRAVGPVTAYNIKPGPGEKARLGLYVDTKTVTGDGPGALPPGIGSPTTFETKITRKGGKSVLTTDVPKVEPLGPGAGEVILTDFQIKIDKKKFHKSGKCKKKGKKSFFDFQAAFTYADGSTKLVKNAPKCKK